MKTYKVKLQYKIILETEVDVKAESAIAAMNAIPTLNIPKTQFDVVSATEPSLRSIEEIS